MSGTVLALAVRPAKDEPMQQVESVQLHLVEGVIGDHGKDPRRQVTLLDLSAWQAACEESSHSGLSWLTRRAQVLVEGIDLAGLIGSTISLGSATILVLGEVEPCWQMEEAAVGLEAAMIPECRGGVYAQVVAAGAVAIGDSLT